MPYNYQTERPKLFTTEGITKVIQLGERVHKLCAEAGAVRLQEAAQGVFFQDTWFMLACFDRLVELGELREVTGPFTIGQHRIFVRPFS